MESILRQCQHNVYRRHERELLQKESSKIPGDRMMDWWRVNHHHRLLWTGKIFSLEDTSEAQQWFFLNSNSIIFIVSKSKNTWTILKTLNTQFHKINQTKLIIRFLKSHLSRSWAKCVIVNHGNILPYMFEKPISNIFRMNVLNSNVHVQTSLNVIHRNVWFFEIVSSSSHTVRDCLVSGRQPWSLDLCDLFSVTCLFLQLTGHVCNGLYSFFWGRVETTCWFVANVHLWDCTCSSVVVLLILITLFIYTGVISVLLVLWML